MSQFMREGAPTPLLPSPRPWGHRCYDLPHLRDSQATRQNKGLLQPALLSLRGTAAIGQKQGAPLQESAGGLDLVAPP